LACSTGLEGSRLLLSPLWRDWYKNAHQLRSRAKGQEFEDYVTSVLRVLHDDFVNPTPTGTLGDGGCDGLAEAGDIVYACFGSSPQRNAEKVLKKKMEDDFGRAVAQWEVFTRWRFITNSPAGPECAHFISETQQKHLEGSERPIAVRLWTVDDFWTGVVSRLPVEELDLLFPGCPGVKNIELNDLIPLLEELTNIDAASEEGQPVRPVPIDKMDYNIVPELKRFELNEWRHLADRIDTWFDGLSDPDLRDHQGAKFRGIYLKSRGVDSDPAAILERIYVSLGGNDFRFDTRRANAVYAVTSYFFDSCHIFEIPPEKELGDQSVASN
jgi:hypothetical protein